MSSDKKSIYVGNLPCNITEQFLLALFQNFGEVININIMRDINNRIDPYAFIEYADMNAASIAVSSMNSIRLFDREIKVNWATQSGGTKDATSAQSSGVIISNSQLAGVNSASQSSCIISGSKMDYSKGSHIFVGDISQDVTDELLREAFQPYGAIIDAKVVRYQDGRSRGYGFVAFENREHAQNAINDMDKSWIMNRAIRCNWASRNCGEMPSGSGDGSMASSGGMSCSISKVYTPKPYEMVYNESPLTNTNVYVGGINEDLTEDLIRSHFEEFGEIDAVKPFPDKGFAFIHFRTHDVAAKAISRRHGYRINNQVIKCWWGKENFGVNAAASNASSQMIGSNSASSSMFVNSTQHAQQQHYSSMEAYQQQCMQYYQQYYPEYYKQYCDSLNAAANSTGGYAAAAANYQDNNHQHQKY